MNTTSSYKSASVFESFNARSLAPEQVAQTFVPSTAFSELVARSHATVIGPRGSGKTSFLKMLQPRALENWQAAEAASFRAKIDYTGVFIPTDISWNRQTSALIDGLPPNTTQLFRTAAFTTHVLHELIDVFCWRVEGVERAGVQPFRRVAMDLGQQRAIARQLATAWELSPQTESFIGIKHALAARQNAIWTEIQRAALAPPTGVSFARWLSLDMLSSCALAVELFDDAIRDASGRWALLFDELELAPEWIMRGLLTALRSTNQKFIFKLAISPFNESYEALKNATQGVPGQDYIEIKLWHSHKEDGLAFSRRLFLRVCQDAGLTLSDPSEFLGRSVIEDDEEWPKAYRRGSRQYRVIDEALKSDSTFALHWKRQGLNINTLANLPEEQRAAKVRKIYPLLLMRNYFRTPDSVELFRQQSRRGRKSLEIYSGADSILTIAEGNPRWIIGMTRSLIQELAPGTTHVSGSVQAKLVEDTIHRFRARLKTVNIPGGAQRGKMDTLLSFLDKVGEFFRAHTIVAEFDPQPPLSFTVDSTITEDVALAIGRALNSGALVYAPEKTSIGLLNDVKGKRFRLSYLLAADYSLPLRLGASVPLSRILSGPTATSAQRELFE